MDSKKSSTPEQQGAGKGNFWVHHASSGTLVTDVSGPDPRLGRENHPTRQRFGIRKAVPCSLLVKVGSSYVLAHRIQDISLVGAYVEMHTAGLVPGEIVDIVIDFSYDGRQVEHQISAEIARVDERGVGLKFNAYGDRTYTDLINLLYAS